MKIEELKQGQAVWVKGFVDRSVFGSCGGFINFYNQDGNHCGHISRNNVREMKEEDVQIDQPKPVVQKFLADWYEEHKDNFYLNLHRLAWELIENLDEDDFVPKKALDSDFKRWYHKTETAIQTLINMHQFGYTVEKEKLYTVVIPNPHEKQLSYVLMRRPNGNVIINVVHSSNLDLLKTDNDLQLTEQEIRKDFDWAWQFAKEVTE